MMACGAVPGSAAPALADEMRDTAWSVME